ncbi:MAG TPA: CapA family protein [Symbiobacteriaceae bacterium]|nr:CapA family protein [Symbiobacteriaceae bacterium]
MRKRWAGVVLATLLLAGCTARETKPKSEIVIAVAADWIQQPVSGARYVVAPDPLAALQKGEAQAALAPGPVPTGFESFPVRVSDQVLVQPWLTTPISLTVDEARRSPTPPLRRMRLSEVQPGWQPVAVGGVVPTPETIWSGKYPLAEVISVVYRPGVSAAVLDQLRVEPPAPWATLSVAGDFMLARGVARAMRENGTLYPVLKAKDHLAAADLTFVNLESPIGVKGTPLPGKQIWFRAAPEAMEILKAAGIDGVTVANNHILDYDTESFLETLDGLQQAGIKYVGGGRNIAEARKPMVLEAKGVKIAFLGYSQFADLFFDWHYPRSFSATEALAGVPRIQDDWLAEDIRAAKALAPIVAVAFHWGDEFQNYPNEEQKRIARRTIDLGADLVLGYHPHAIQGFELYKGRVIAYSTGNFIMDRQDTDLARESMIIDLKLAPDGVKSASVLPVWIRAEQPYIMTGAEGEQLLKKIRTISEWK